MPVPESPKEIVFMEFPNSHGSVRRHGSPIFVGMPSMVTAEHCSLRIPLEDFLIVGECQEDLEEILRIQAFSLTIQ